MVIGGGSNIFVGGKKKKEGLLWADWGRENVSLTDGGEGTLPFLIKP